MKYFVLFFLLISILFAETLHIFPKEVAIFPGKKLQFCVFQKENGAFHTPSSLRWNVEKGKITNSGLFTAPQQLGKYKIRVFYKNFSSEAIVYVKSSRIDSIKTIQILSDGKVYEGKEKKLQAVAYDNKGNEVYFQPIWKSRGVGTISKNGVFISEHSGEANIFVEDTNSPVFGSIQFRVNPNNIHKVVVFPGKTTLVLQGKTKFFATAYDINGKEVAIRPKWYVEGSGSIKKDGSYVAGSYRGNAKVWAKDPVSEKKGYSSISISASQSAGKGRILIGTFFNHNNLLRISYQVFGTNIHRTELHAILQNGTSQQLGATTCLNGDNIVFEKQYPYSCITVEIRIFDNYNRIIGNKRKNLK